MKDGESTSGSSTKATKEGPSHSEFRENGTTCSIFAVSSLWFSFCNIKKKFRVQMVDTAVNATGGCTDNTHCTHIFLQCTCMHVAQVQVTLRRVHQSLFVIKSHSLS